MSKKKVKEQLNPYPFLLNYDYMIGITLGLIIGWIMRSDVLFFIILIWSILIIERILK